jgi:hypothetical protein
MNVHVHERLWKWLYASEGAVSYMYLDKLGLVTVGIGFMIDPIDQHIGEWGNSFVKANGAKATPSEVRAEFVRVKKKMEDKGSHLKFKADAQLFLPAEAMKPRVLKTLKEKEALVKSGWSSTLFADFDSFPPDAQMGVLSTAYGWWENRTPEQKAFSDACNKQNWAAAATSGRWDGWEPPKIKGHKLMFANAQAAKDKGDNNPHPAFPGSLGADVYEIDDQVRPYRQDIWTVG